MPPYIYIEPILHIHATIAEAKDFFDTSGPFFSWNTKKQVSIDEITKENFNLIVGDPGVGKTELLKKIESKLGDQGVTYILIQLKDLDAIDRIDALLNNGSTDRHALLLDGLDEVRSNLFPVIIKKIGELSQSNRNFAVFLASRWIFAARYASLFRGYRIVTISPFKREQVTQYLTASGYDKTAIGSLLDRLFSFSHSILIVQIPRYLFLFAEFLREREIDSIMRVSRNELFEYFIYSKLELEDQRLNADKRVLTKRLLEKIALTMEIYQTNTIRKDELMTLFDDLQSDLKLVALTQLDLEMLFEKTLLCNNHDSIEFDNTEFQEYLAAKEITRFSNPRRAAFAFAVNQEINELHPSWFNTLTFLIDMQPDLLEQIVEFSGIRGSKLIDEGFLNFLSRINPSNLSISLRQTLFRDALAYHQNNLQWFYFPLANSLPGLFDLSLESDLKAEVSRADKESGPNRYIRLANIAIILAHLFPLVRNLDKDHWREFLITSAIDNNENGVLQRYSLFALEQLGDPSVIDRLPESLAKSEELIARSFLSMCIALAPESPRSLQYIFDFVRRGEIEGRYGLYALKAKYAIAEFLQIFIQDKAFRHSFLDQSSIFNDRDNILIENIATVFDLEIAGLAMNAVLSSFKHTTAREARDCNFVLRLTGLIKNNFPDLFYKLWENIVGDRSLFYHARPLIAALTNTAADLDRLLAEMAKRGDKSAEFKFLLEVRASGVENAEQLFNDRLDRFPKEYTELLAEQEQAKTLTVLPYQQQLLEKLRALLEQEPAQYNQDIFAFYLGHANDLARLITSSDKELLTKAITDVFARIDPADYPLTITQEHAGGGTTYTYSSYIPLFRDAVLVADNLEMNTASFRQRIINYIPFAFSSELKAIFRLAGDISPQELSPIIEIYQKHESDLWRHRPSNFIDAAERYHISNAISVLRAFVTEKKIDPYTRQRALKVAESLVPDKAYLESVAEIYSESKDSVEAAISNTATDLLISEYADADSIRKKLRAVIEKASPLSRPHSANAIDAQEHEITIGRVFVKPLMELRIPGFEQDYLKLLDQALILWAKGKEFYDYATYLWDTAYAYFDNLKETGSYQPLKILEDKIDGVRNREGANWLAARMIKLRRSYLAHLGRPRNIAEAIQQYNASRNYHEKGIYNSQDLARHLQDAFETELRQWIEAEGAYEILGTSKVFKSKIQQYEKLVQKTLKNKIENILLKRGFQVEVDREPQLLDDKRTDMLIRYGFAGPVILEVKLTSNKDMQTSNPKECSSYKSMQKYMKGYGATRGIFLIINNKKTKHLKTIAEAYQQIPNVWVKVFDCLQ
jgi:hypothetical protein